MTLAKWNYTKEEWQRFRHWESKKWGIAWNWLEMLNPFSRKHVPEIRIAEDRVWFNDEHEPFQNSHRRFMETNIREAGTMNILEINYENGNRMMGINIPIPKGKLKEAFEVQERLSFEGGLFG